MPFYKKLFKKRKIVRLKAESLQAQKKAEFLASPRGLAIETIKGMPTATLKIGRDIKRVLAGGAYGEQMEKRARATPEGKELMESLETEGFWKTFKKYRKK